jgi:DNA-binding response OmpR family regulator
MLRKSIALAALALASALASKAGSAQARDTLLNRVHGRDADIEPRTIDVHRGTSYALDTDRH